MTRFTLPESDGAFVRRITDIVVMHISDPDFDTSHCASLAGISRMHLNRRLRALTGQSTHQFIRFIRLRRSEILLRGRWSRISDIAHEVGYRSPSHFARAFREQFGVLPSVFQTQEILASVLMDDTHARASS